MTRSQMSGKHASALGVRGRFDIYRARIRAIANLLAKGQPVEATDSEIGTLVGLNRDETRITRQLMMYIGALGWSTIHRPQQQNWRAQHWTLLLDGADLEKAIDYEMERQMRGGLSPVTERKKAGQVRRNPPNPRAAERVAVATDRLGLETGAIVGPEAPNPMRQVATVANAPEALIMAAKQYRARRAGSDEAVARAKALVAQLEEIGVPVPPELRSKASVAIDGRLETILEVLPYVERLERQLVGLQDQMRNQPKVTALQQTIDRQRSQIERLVAQRTQEALGEHPRRS